VPEEPVEEAELPTPQLMIDSLYQILMKRLDEIEEKIDKLNG
jgi:tetrahydromethanopterin S-methyltransferase subunit G